MIYLDNAATSFPKPPCVHEAMAKFLAEDAANPGRAGHRMAVRAEEMLDAARLKLTRLFDGDDFHRMIFALNCTDALNIAIKGVLAPSANPTKTPHVITTVLEHNSVSRPLRALADEKRIALTQAPCDGDGFVNPDEIRHAIQPNTVMIVMTHASNVAGTIQDAAAVGAIAREHDILYCLDAAQTAGIVPISIRQMQIDLLAFPGHKSLLGPTGTGALYVGERCRLQPWREGGTGGDSASPTQPGELPHYLEGGTPNTVGIAGLSAGVDYILAHDMAATLAHEQAMVTRVIDRYPVLGTTDATKRVGTVSFNVDGYEPSDVGAILDDSFDIAVRPGLHCAPYCHRRFATFPSGAVRVSPGPFNTDAEVDQLLDALAQIAE